MTAIAQTNQAVKAPYGVEQFELIDVPLPANSGNRLAIQVGYMRREGPALPGWRAATALAGATFSRTEPLNYRCKPFGTRAAAVLAAVEGLVNELVDRRDASGGSRGQRLSAMIVALGEWSDAFEKQAKKESTAMSVSKSPKILTGKECRALLEEFRRCYACLEHAFVELGEKAAAIRDQEAYGESCSTFDEWIKREHYARSVIYDAIKAAKFYRLTSPVAEPLKIVLDREAHFREFPADASKGQAEKIIKQLGETVEPDADGSRHPTAKQIKAAVAAVCPKPAERTRETKAAVAETIQADRETQEPEAGRQAPRLAPQTITGEYAEVHAAQPGGTWTEDLDLFRSEVLRMLAPLLDRHGRDGQFLYAAYTALHDIAVDVRYHEPAKATAARRAK